MSLTGSSPEEQAERPLRADAARNRSRILASARELFAEHGLAVSMDEIARHAGVGVGTVYRRFPDREAVIEALFDERVEQVISNAEHALEDPDPWNGLVRYLEGHMAMQASDRGLGELLHGPLDLRERIGDLRARMLPLVQRLLERAQASGRLRDDIALSDMPALSLMISATVDYGGELDPELWRRYLGLLLDALSTRRDGPSPLPRPPLATELVDKALGHCRPGRR
jgi:AcrR family transcriptional regulator